MYILDRTWFVILMLVFVTPFGIYLLWRNGLFPVIVRVLITALCSIIIVLASYFVVHTVGSYLSGSNENPTQSIEEDTKKPKDTMISDEKESTLSDEEIAKLKAEQQDVIDKLEAEKSENKNKDTKPKVVADIKVGTTTGTSTDSKTTTSNNVASDKMISDTPVTQTTPTTPSTPTVVTPDPVTPPATNTTTTVTNLKVVYIMSSGGNYHEESCSSLTGNKIPISLEAAVAAGLKPCTTCIK